MAAATTGNSEGFEDEEVENKEKYNVFRDRKTKEQDKDYLKIPKAWLHVIGSLLTANIIAVVVAAVSLYVDVQILKQRSSDQIDVQKETKSELKELRSLVLRHRRTSSSKDGDEIYE